MDTSTPIAPICLPKDITPETFLRDYWQKKPLLIKNGLPALKNLFEPCDILALATDDNVSARLIYQKDKPAKNTPCWQVTSSPLTNKNFKRLPKHWTVLIQNLEQWSLELGELWQAFDFIPKWQQDDIMVSYAPDGGSVGKHYDEYDVFLAQGYGRRRWQLGRFCDEHTTFLPNEPIRLLDEMGEMIFDEVLDVGDVLYVPPRLAHYGVAVGECLTFSFGFRRPNLVQVLDKLADVATTCPALFLPLTLNQTIQTSHTLSNDSIAQIKAKLIETLSSDNQLFDHAIAELVSRRQYDLLNFYDELSVDELHELLQLKATLTLNHASRVIQVNDNWYINGELILFDKTATDLMLRLLNADIITINDWDTLNSQLLTDWVNNGWLSINQDE